MTFPPLYRKSTQGRILFWVIEVEGSKWRTHYGLVGYKGALSAWVNCESKNKGRKNETTPEEQAQIEARAGWIYREKTDHFTTVELAESSDLIKPKLAAEFDANHERIVYPVRAQRKIDGVRAIMCKGNATSREGLPVPQFTYIAELLERVQKENPFVVAFDGELYNHKYKEDFDKILSLYRKGPEYPDELPYHIFDYIDIDPSVTTEERFAKLAKIFETYSFPSWILPVESVVINNREELDAHYETLLDEGYEGQMVINPIARYEMRRTTGLLKRKEFVTEECQIIGCKQGTGSHEGKIAFTLIRTDVDGTKVEFDSPVNGKLSTLGDLWDIRETLVGQWATVRRSKQLTPQKRPRFPKVICIRECAEDGTPLH